MIKTIRDFEYGAILLVAMVWGTLTYGPGLPEMLPSRFTTTGEVLDYMPKSILLWVLPAALAGSMVMTSFLVRFSPRIWAMPNTRPVLKQIYFAIGCLLAAIHFGILKDPQGGPAIGEYFGFGASLFLIVFGNIMGKAEPNFFIGLKLPWTLASENNWNVTHRLTGKLCMVSGVFLFFVTFYQKDILYLLPFVLVPLFIGVGYSFYFYLKNERPLEEK